LPDFQQSQFKKLQNSSLLYNKKRILTDFEHDSLAFESFKLDLLQWFF